MAAQDKVTFKQDLTEPVKIRHYEGVVFTGDDCGNLIKVALFDGGVPYSGGGTVSATAILADGTTFPLTHGSITGNMVSVPLEAGALVVSGLMGLYVKISGSGIICTVLNAIFTVQVTDTGMVPAAMVTTVNELVQEIKDAQDSFPADLTNLLAAVAPTFSTSTAYSAGAYVWQGGKLYRFTAAHPAGTWTRTDAVTVALGNDVADLKSALDGYIFGNAIEFDLSGGVLFNISKNVYIKAGQIVTVTTQSSPVGVIFTYSDGTTEREKIVRPTEPLRYRTKKDIISILIANDSRTAIAYVSVSDDPLYITNYYNRQTAQAGRVTDTSQIAYYHTDYIPITLGEKIIFSGYPGVFGNSIRVYLFDSNKTRVGYVEGIERQDGLFEYDLSLDIIGTVINTGNICYCEFDLTAAGKDSAVCYRNIVPDEYINYGDYQPETPMYFNEKQKNYIDNKCAEVKEEIDEETSNVYTHETSVNLFDYNSPLTEINKFWQSTTKIDLTNYVITNPIQVNVGDVLIHNFTTLESLYGNIGEYVDSNGNAIQSIRDTMVEITTEGYVKLIATKNAYVQFNIRSWGLSTTMIVKNTEMPSEYVQFKDEYNFTPKVNVSSLDGNESVLKEKRIAYNGDSICESRTGTGTSNNGGAYAKIISDIVEGSYENRAIAGGILASAVPSGYADPARKVVLDVENMDSSADLVCFEGGYNDYAKSVPLGTMTAESDLTGTLDTTTICGALESIFRQAIIRWLGKPIVFVIVHKVQNSYYTQNNAATPYTFKDVHDKIVEICHKYAIPYYDACLESGLNGHNALQSTTYLTSNDTGAGDGTHPNEAGYRRYYVPQLIALFESILPRLEDN